ncbi:dihydrolipoyllysine-residue acetyltransferase [Arenicellales bacterium IMCC56312]
MTSTQEIKVPDIGDFESVDVIEVLVKPGDHISAEDPLITLESDKATMDVPSPKSGVVKEVLISIGDKVAEGSIVAVLNSDSNSDTPPENSATTIPNTASVSESEVKPSEAESHSESLPAPAKKSTPAPQNELPVPSVKTGDPRTPTETGQSSSRLPHASPAVRRFARELGVDLSQVKGSGPRERILEEDVQGFVKHAISHNTGSQIGLPKLPDIDFGKWGSIDLQPLSRIKKIAGKHLHQAWSSIPHVTHHDETDITDLEAFRKSLKIENEGSGIRITLLAFIIKAVVNALKAFPTFNASLSTNGENLILKNYFNIGVAVDTDDGLVVPVIKEVDQKGVLEIAQLLGDLSERARSGKLKSDELQGGCFSISSLGGIGGMSFTPIVNMPEVAILGLTKARIKPVWNGTEFSPRLMLPLDLSYDHRVIDGAEAARFTAHLVQVLEDSRRLLL